MKIYLFFLNRGKYFSLYNLYWVRLSLTRPGTVVSNRLSTERAFVVLLNGMRTDGENEFCVEAHYY